MEYFDERLPKGLCVFENIHHEFVVVNNSSDLHNNGVIHFDHGMVLAGENVEEAVNNYINRKVYK